MGRQNKKEAVADLHREKILTAAEKMFSEKGFAQTTIEDISKVSEYSRRTIYAYYESKDDILHHIVEKGLQSLKCDIENALSKSSDFLGQYKGICMAMKKYQAECPHSLESVTESKTSKLDLDNLSPTVANVLSLGTKINELLADFIEQGKNDGFVRNNIITMQTVYILWTSISSLLSLVQTKGSFLFAFLGTSEEDFLEYGFKQIINSILEEHI